MDDGRTRIEETEPGGAALQDVTAQMALTKDPLSSAAAEDKDGKHDPDDKGAGGKPLPEGLEAGDALPSDRVASAAPNENDGKKAGEDTEAERNALPEVLEPGHALAPKTLGALIVAARAGDLARLFAAAADVTPGKSPMPALLNTLVERDGEALSVTSGDGEHQMTIRVEAQNIDGHTAPPYRRAVEAKRIAELLKSLPKDDDAWLWARKERLIVSTKLGRFTFATIDGDEYPLIKRVGCSAELELSEGTLKRLLAGVAHSMASDDANYVLNGAALQTKGVEAVCVATDRRRLALETHRLEKPIGNCNVVLPRGVVATLMKLLTSTDSAARLELGPGQAVLSIGPRKVVMNLIEGEFPEWRTTVPRPKSNLATVNRADALRAIKAARVMTEAANRCRVVRLEFDHDELQVNTSEDAAMAETSIPMEYAGERMSLSFNADFLIDTLSRMVCDRVEIGLTDESSPVLVRNQAVPDELSVLMPLRAA